MKRYLIYSLLLISIISLWVYRHYYFYEPSPVTTIPVQELMRKQLAASALSRQSVWNESFLARNPIIKDKINRFEQGEICKNLKELDNKRLAHQQILGYLKKEGFTCIIRPLTTAPSPNGSGYLKIDNTITHNPKDKGVAHQEICQNRRQPECVIRIKRDGFPLNRRSTPHSSKAVLIDRTGDPGSYNNEAFKISSQGQALPKGPSGKFGLRKCPYGKDKKSCNQWVDMIMEEAHPPLKNPQATNYN